MSRTDRAVRRTGHHLVADEALVASALGREVDGRRRQVVVMTDKRVLVVGLRAEPPAVLVREGCRAEYDATGGLLTFKQGDRELMVRDVEEEAAHRMVALLARHRSSLVSRGTRTLHHIRILQE
jgi:hypothetical protein